MVENINNSLIKLYEYIKNKKILAYTLLLFIISIFVYLGFLTEQLANNAEGTIYGQYYMASNFVLSQGRFMWYVFSHLIQKGNLNDPYNSYLALFIISLAVVLILDLFRCLNKIGIISSLMFMGSVAITHILSYKHESVVFAFSILFAVLSVYALLKIKNLFLNLIINIFCALMVYSFYPANIAFTSMIFIGILIIDLYYCVDFKVIIKKVGMFVISHILGMLFYKQITDIILKKMNLALSAQGGFNNASLKEIMLNLPNRFALAYEKFYGILIKRNIYTMNYMHKGKLYLLIFILILAVVIILSYKKLKNRIPNLILIFVLLLLLPAACLEMALMSKIVLFPIRSTTLSFIFTFFVILIYNFDNDFFNIKKMPIKNFICFLIFSYIFFGQLGQIAIDTTAMYEGKKTCYSFANKICDDIMDENMLGKGKIVIFLGCPANNKLFYVSPNYYKANSFARYGTFSNAFVGKMYRGLIKNLVGYNIKLSERVNLERRTKQAKDMPVFPTKGYIKEFADCIIVKVSNDK